MVISIIFVGLRTQIYFSIWQPFQISHMKILLAVLFTLQQGTFRGATKSFAVLCDIVWAATTVVRQQPRGSHASNIVSAPLAKRVSCTKFQSSLLNIHFRLSEFQALRQLI